MYICAISIYDFAACQLPVPLKIFISEGKEGRATLHLLESVSHLGRHRDESPARVNTALRSNLHLYTVLELRGHTHAFMYASMSSPLNP